MPRFPEIPGYTINKELGKGGMATVFLAYDQKLDRNVALKMIAVSELDDDTFSKRFIKEAKTAGRLNHSNILPIFDTGRYKDKYYIAMEFLPGGTLNEKIKDGLFNEMEAVDILLQLGRALDYAHSKGFIHRDIKPENIMFREDGTPILVDFGIAKALHDDIGLTATGMSIGTILYMSPEQAQGVKLDESTDFYSLGVVFYEMLTGRVPYYGKDHISTLAMHVSAPIPKLSGKLSKYQPLIDQLLAKNTTNRIRNSNTLNKIIRELGGKEFHREKFIETEVITFKKGEKELKKSYPSNSKNKLVLTLVLTLIVLIGVMTLLILKQNQPSKQHPKVNLKKKDEFGIKAKKVASLAKNKGSAINQDSTKSSTLPDGDQIKKNLRHVDYDVRVLKIEWIKIPAGSFNMGSDKGAEDERPVRSVFLDEFFISKFEVTFQQYDLFCIDTSQKKRDDEGWGRGEQPVINVTWHDAADFCGWLSAKTGKVIHLPTEAQWEKACKEKSSGTGVRSLDVIAWHKGNSGFKAHRVGIKLPNSYGIFDMLGNVSEWCLDWYGKDYYKKSPLRNPPGPIIGDMRIIRGGGWNSQASVEINYLRSAFRSSHNPDHFISFIGFRIIKRK